MDILTEEDARKGIFTYSIGGYEINVWAKGKFWFFEVNLLLEQSVVCSGRTMRGANGAFEAAQDRIVAHLKTSEGMGRKANE